MQEKEIEKRFKRAIEKKGGLCFKWVSPGTRGVPDRIVLLPGGKMYLVEMKRPGGVCSPVQKLLHKKIEALGTRVYVVASDEEADRLLEEWAHEAT